MTIRRILAILCTLAVACGDDDRPTTDGGPGDPDGTAPTDTVPPFVVGTDPADEETGVAVGRDVTIFFSEAMATDVGAASATADGEPLTLGEGVWDESARELRFTPELPADATIVLSLSAFEDVAGNVMVDVEVSFSTVDGRAPRVTSATPSEGTDDAELTFDARFEIDEALASDRGAAALIGPEGDVGTIRFEGTTLVVPVSGLRPDTEYSLALSDFADESGNALVGGDALGDLALDFSTAPDTAAPQVVDAMPGEGTVDVPASTQTATLIFDEPMMRSGTVTYAGEALSTSWRSDTRLVVQLPAPLPLSATVSLVLAGFVDLAGNALDGEAYLGDGALDFTLGEDLFAPYVVGSLPEEGAVDVAYDVPRLVVAFSEAMDTSVTAVTVQSALGTATIDGTWSESGTLLEVDATDVVAGQTYRLSFPGFEDVGGTALDVAHPYLGDGALDFETEAPTGERCRDALDVARATSSSGGRHEWVLPAATFESADGPMTCDTTTSDDAVIRVRKLGDSTVLRVTVESANTDELVVQATRGVCDTTTEAGVAAITRCLPNSNQWGFHLEGPAGDYFVWVAHESTGNFDGATVVVEELAPPEGETCAEPLDTASTSFYTAPPTAGDFHTWTVPTDGVLGYDRGSVNGDADDFACNDDTERGADFVVRWDKSTATSLVEIEVSIGTENGLVEILDGACLPSAGATRGACEPGFTGSRTYLIDGPARPLFVWVAADDDGLTSDPFSSYFPPSATVRVREIEPGLGDSCSSAIPLVVGDNAVTPTGTRSLGAPSCAATALTWYRFTASTTLSVVTGNGFAPAGIVTTSGTELSCSGSVVSGVAAFTAPGAEYCVAVASGGAVTNLRVESVPYAGVTGATVTDLLVEPYEGSSSIDDVFDPEDWIAVTPTYVYLASDNDRLMRAPRTGGVIAEELLEDATVMGEAGVAVGEAIFGVDDLRSGANRLFRYVAPDGTFGVMPWDTGSTYVNAGIDVIAYDGTSLLLASSRETTSPQPITFYSADPSTPGPVTLLGTNDSLSDVSAMVADATYLYVVGTVGTTEGVYRLVRSELGNPAAAVEELQVGGASFDHSNDNASLVLQPASGGAPSVLYFRPYNPADVFAILSPESVSPRFLGQVFGLGRNNDDYVLALDPSVPALFLTEEETDLSNPRWLRVE
ncbi:MAG: Ig-like domain-containing protein [Myxococcota bacterium]|nr:Ig-like domain-containing protein [Myxococcota bacterium]